jgi:aryl-alcohol dehydrogenase-like predicted oxidoreductase
MKYRIFGRTGVEVSEIGLGTWQLGGADWGAIDESTALTIMATAADAGVTLFDTADVYGMGVSERLIGRFLRESRAKVHVATKLGRAYCVRHGWPARFTYRMVREDTERSLRHLGVDSLFLQQWHCIPTAMLRSGEVFDHLERLREDGLVRHWGCSVETVEEGLVAMTHPGCAALQVIYNIFRQKLTDDLLPVARRCRVAILARVPLASGLLSGRFTRDQRFPKTDHRHYNRNGQAFNVGETFAGLPFGKGVDLAAEVRAILKPRGGASLAQLALRWVLDQEGVSTVIPGATRAEHVDDNVAASALKPLRRAQHAALRALYDAKIARAIRGPY